MLEVKVQLYCFTVDIWEPEKIICLSILNSECTGFRKRTQSVTRIMILTRKTRNLDILGDGLQEQAMLLDEINNPDQMVGRNLEEDMEIVARLPEVDMSRNIQNFLIIWVLILSFINFVSFTK